MNRDGIFHYRCKKFSSKCLSKIRIDKKRKTAVLSGKHNHKPMVPRKAISIGASKTTDSKAKVSSALTVGSRNVSNEGLESLVKEDVQFNKDVTSEVELITNDREVTLMFHKGHKFTKYFENKTHTSYRCVCYTKHSTECQARLKHSTDYGEVLMRSDHNHPSDHNAYQAFLNSAVKVRKFTKKSPRMVVETSSSTHITSSSSKVTKKVSDNDINHDLGDFALAMTRIRNGCSEENQGLLDSTLDQSLLVKIKTERKD